MVAQYGGSAVAYLRNGQVSNLALPPGTVNGDCLFAITSQGGNLVNTTGWNLVQNTRARVYQRVAANEPASYGVRAADLTQYGADGKGAVVFFRYTKTDVLNPVKASVGVEEFQDADDVINVPGVGPAARGGMTIGIVAATYSSTIPSATSPGPEWTQRASFNQDNTGEGLIRIYDSPGNELGFSVTLGSSSTLSDLGIAISLFGGAAGGFFF